ncbi:hypothetical protein [Variovorax brevis]|uniref:hypothetical protein n=1 Tax=Variovorax brevis TaxID=3053503 RepID=UPI004037E69D
MPSYPSEKLIAVVWNRNLMVLYVANAAVIAAQDPGLVPRMRLLREKHGACMPPTSAGRNCARAVRARRKAEYGPQTSVEAAPQSVLDTANRKEI